MWVPSVAWLTHLQSKTKWLDCLTFYCNQVCILVFSIAMQEIGFKSAALYTANTLHALHVVLSHQTNQVLLLHGPVKEILLDLLGIWA